MLALILNKLFYFMADENFNVNALKEEGLGNLPPAAIPPAGEKPPPEGSNPPVVATPLVSTTPPVGNGTPPAGDGTAPPLTGGEAPTTPAATPPVIPFDEEAYRKKI